MGLIRQLAEGVRLLPLVASRESVKAWKATQVFVIVVFGSGAERAIQNSVSEVIVGLDLKVSRSSSINSFGLLEVAVVSHLMEGILLR